MSAPPAWLTSAKTTRMGRPVANRRHAFTTLLLATVAALLLVPAAQAAAEEGTGTVKVNIVGSGSGEVNSSPGFEFAEGPGSGEGYPPITECIYVSPGPAGPDCTNTPEVEAGNEFVVLRAIAAPGSVFAGWTVDKGIDNGEFCAEWNAYTLAEWEEFNGGYACMPFAFGEGKELEVTATFTSTAPTMTVEIKGTGSGEVSSVGGYFEGLSWQGSRRSNAAMHRPAPKPAPAQPRLSKK